MFNELCPWSQPPEMVSRDSYAMLSFTHHLESILLFVSQWLALNGLVPFFPTQLSIRWALCPCESSHALSTDGKQTQTCRPTVCSPCSAQELAFGYLPVTSSPAVDSLLLIPDAPTIASTKAAELSRVPLHFPLTAESLLRASLSREVLSPLSEATASL